MDERTVESSMLGFGSAEVRTTFMLLATMGGARVSSLIEPWFLVILTV